MNTPDTPQPHATRVRTSASRGGSEIPPLLLERLACGELDEAARERLRQEFGDRALDEAVARLRADDAAVLARMPASAFAAQVRERAAARTSSEHATGRRLAATPATSRWAAPGALLLSAAAAALVWFGPAPDPAQPPAMTTASPTTSTMGAHEGLEPTRLKGDDGAGLFVWRGHPGQARAELLPSGAPVRAGDMVQVSYRAGQARHGVILSIDGAGQATLHFPASATGSTALSPGQSVALDHAYELDDAPRYERFFFLTSAAPLDVPQVMQRAREIAARREPIEALPLDQSAASAPIHQHTVSLQKVSR